MFSRQFTTNFYAESFYIAFKPVLFDTRALDDAGCSENIRYWHVRKYHGADTLRHDYLVFTCRNKTDESVGRFVEIRNVANALFRHCKAQDHDLNLDAVLDGLCWLALERGTKYPGRRQGWDSHCGRENEFPNPGLNLLSAGTYFGCVSLVRNLLGQGYDPTEDNNLFPAPMYLAAWTGRADMLQLMQEHLPEFEDLDPSNPWVDFHSKIGPGSLLGAVVRGDMDIVRLALYPPSRIIPPLDDDDDDDKEKNEKKETVPNPMLVLGEKPGSVLVGSKLCAYIAQGMRRTRSPEIYEYLQSFFNQTEVDPDTKNYDLAKKAEAGDIVMVRHLLETGADPADKKKIHGGPPLVHAVRAWHEDIVDLLLEHGADPNERGKYRLGTPLTAAAKAGSMVMLRKLLHAGAKIVKADTMTLRYAVKLEHTAMVELLLRMGAGGKRGRRQILETARDRNLESMVDILKRWGVS